MLRLILMALLLVATFGVQNLFAQSWWNDKIDTVAVGDTALVALIPPLPDCFPSSDCACDPPEIRLSNDSQMKLFGHGIFFMPSRPGNDVDTLITECYCYEIVPDHLTCGGDGYYHQYEIGIYAITDSLPQIRPLPEDSFGLSGWSLTMIPDSLGKIWTNHSAPTFDNPISDTTLFSDFSAKQRYGTSVSLQVFDSSIPITEYKELPFTRKHPLNLIFSSPNYQSFDTVIFSTRMQHGSVDSVISYALPVTWQAPSSVSNPSDHEISYSLPNPFTDHISIGFSLDKSENVKASLFDVPGREVRSEEQEFDAGTREITFDTRDLPAGSYFYVLRGAEWNRSEKLVKIQP